MPKKKSKSSEIPNIQIDGNVRGQIAIGNDISQSQVNSHPVATPAEMDDLRQLINELRSKIETDVAPAKKDSALERVGELEQALTEEKPDLTTMEYVKNWFRKNVPALAGMVTSVVVHPIVGKLVEAGGDMLVKDFNKRFGGEA
jgi:hypothetical protein